MDWLTAAVFHYNRDGVRAYTDSVGWDFPVECRFMSLQPNAIYICPLFEISFDLLLLTKGSEASLAAAMDGIMAFSSFSQNAPFGCFVPKILRKVGLFKWKSCKVVLWRKLMEIVGNALWMDGAILVSLPFEQITSAHNVFLSHIISFFLIFKFFREK